MATVGSVMPENLTAKAASQLREVAAFLDRNAEALVGDMDSTYVLDTGLRFEFYVLERDSIPTVKVTKVHYVMGKEASWTTAGTRP